MDILIISYVVIISAILVWAGIIIWYSRVVKRMYKMSIEDSKHIKRLNEETKHTRSGRGIGSGYGNDSGGGDGSGFVSGVGRRIRQC